MKNPQYKIGDYVEFGPDAEGKNIRGFIKCILLGGAYRIETRAGSVYHIHPSKIIRKLPILRDKNGRFSKMSTWEEFVTTLPNIVVPEGKNKGKTMSDLVKEKVKMELESVPNYIRALSSKKKSCSCFNCDKCAEQMRAYYEKTGELKPKMGKNWGKIKDSEGNYHEFGQKPYDSFGSRVKEKKGIGYMPPEVLKKANALIEENLKLTEEKKPSERINEIYNNRKDGRPKSINDLLKIWISSLEDYLDEQFEKGKK